MTGRIGAHCMRSDGWGVSASASGSLTEQGHTRIAAMSGQMQSAPTTPFAAERRTYGTARLSLGVPGTGC